MVNTIEKPSERLNTSRLNCPVHEVSGNGLRRKAAVSTRPAIVLASGQAEPLPSMFMRSYTAGAQTKAHRLNKKARFSPYLVALVLLAFAPAQAFLLTSSFSINGEQAVEDALALAKQGAAQAATLISIPTAEAAVSVRSKSPTLERGPSFDDGQWTEAVDSFKFLLADQKASTMKQTENDRRLGRLEAWVNAGI